MMPRRRTNRSLWPGTVVAILLLACAYSAPAAAGVRFGLDLIVPPVLVPIPASPVEYAPSVGANYFFYGGQYYVFANDAWYVASAYDGPWSPVALDLVPLAVLGVPIAYYRFPPPRWVPWRRDRPPRWAPAFTHRPESGGSPAPRMGISRENRRWHRG
jgi:hypothetical protein